MNKGEFMDKYNLHLLGWKQFEEWIAHIMHHVFGSTYTPFSDGKDGGRDGYYVGNGKLLDKELAGRFVFQCKHTSEVNKSFSFSVVSKELSKVKRLVNEIGARHYIIFTNYKLPAKVQESVEKKFIDDIPKLETCTILMRK